MKPLFDIDKAVEKETQRYFTFITQPSDLKSTVSLEKLFQYTKDENLQYLWKLFSERNLNCFKLKYQENSSLKEVYYVDLETPVLFYPVLRESIPFNTAYSFLSIAKIIKSNLLNFYSQEIESLFIWIKRETKMGVISFYTFKLEDQDIKPLQKSGTPKSKRKEISQEDLDKFLSQGHIRKTEFEKIKNNHNSIETEIKPIILQNGKKRIPVGKRSLKNRLNLLTGREWIKFSKTWFIHRPPSRKKEELLHPAKFPETLIRQFITFFTKPGEVVLDPFLGTASTLIAAKQSNRSGVGVELSPEYAKISEQRLKKINIQAYPPLYQTNKPSFWQVICGDSRNLLKYWEDFKLPTVDFCLTSPPYWSQLERNAIRQKKRKEMGLDTKYSNDDPKDLSNLRDYGNFLDEQKKIFGKVYELLRPKGYLVIITNNVFVNRRVYPLAYDTALRLTQDKEHSWILKDEKIWLQDDKSLVALGVNYAWVGNRCHQYCHIFRKEGF
ncbi:MAG: DNA methyltransferase [Candidatus Hodarchaeota archaeon]